MAARMRRFLAMALLIMLRFPLTSHSFDLSHGPLKMMITFIDDE